MEKASEEEEETDEEKIERLTQEIEELRLLLKEVNKDEDPRRWVKLCAAIEEKDTERLLLAEKQRCDVVVKGYFEDNPHILEAVPECPLCFEKQWDPLRTMMHYRCCGKATCRGCKKRGGLRLATICPFCRSKTRGPKEGMADVKVKAENGNVWAMGEIGKRHLKGLEGSGVEKDTEKGLHFLHRAAEKENAQALYTLGNYYVKTRNVPEARRWYKKAATEGDILSLGALGWILLADEGCSEKDKEEAFRLLTVSTSLCCGSKHSDLRKSRLALTFFRESPKLLLHYLRPAAEAGNAYAMEQYSLWLLEVSAEYYDDNICFPGHNPIPEALFWFRRSKNMDYRDSSELDDIFSDMEQTLRICCDQCHKKLSSEKPLCCSECRAAYYCDRECQVAHWKVGHKKDCVKKLKKELKAAGKL